MQKGAEKSLVLITGGCRSGKSDVAQQMAEQIPGDRLFIATCPCLDSEMAERIRQHQEARQGRGWQSREEEMDPSQVIASAAPGTTIVLDCLTLWISNLMHAAGLAGSRLTEADIVPLGEQLARTALQHQGAVIMVSGEVGLGIVPENQEARLYRDLVGRCNRVMAAHADQVFFVSCGLPLQLK